MVDSYSGRLNEAMKEAKVETAQLARTLKISFQAVRKAQEGGKFGTENHLKAAAALGVSSEWLASGKGPKRPPNPEKPANQEPPSPGMRFDALSPDEQRFIENLRIIEADEDATKELMDLMEIKAAKLRAMKEKWLAQIGVPSTPAKHTADARRTEIARAALEVTDNLRQRSLFESPPPKSGGQ